MKEHYLYLDFRKSEDASAQYDGDDIAVVVSLTDKSNVDKLLEKDSIVSLLKASSLRYESSAIARRIFKEATDEMIEYDKDILSNSSKIVINYNDRLPDILKRTKCLQNREIIVNMVLISNYEKSLKSLQQLGSFKNLKFSRGEEFYSFDEIMNIYQLFYVTQSIERKNDDNMLSVSYYGKEEKPLIRRIHDKIKPVSKSKQNVFDVSDIKFNPIIVIDGEDAKIHLFDSVEKCKLSELKTVLSQDKYQNMTLVIEEVYEIDSPELLKMINLLDGLNNVKLKIHGNEENVSISDCKYTIDYINGIVSKIKRFELSPIENCMMAYDLIRDRVYKEEEKSEPTSTSRDITSIITGDKIVCAGYAKLFQIVLKKLGINGITNKIVHKVGKTSHLRNLAYIKDDKYGIDGIYQFDPTWDSKISEEDITFLDSYRYFALTKNAMDSESQNSYYDRTLNGYSPGKASDAVITITDKGVSALPSKTLEFLNTINIIVTGKPLIDRRANKIDDKEILSIVERNNKLMMPEPITKKKLLDIMFYVRQIEHGINPEKYNLDMLTFRNAISYRRPSDLVNVDDDRRCLLPAVYIRLRKKEIPIKIKELTSKR